MNIADERKLEEEKRKATIAKSILKAYYIDIGDLKDNDFIFIRGKPCKLKNFRYINNGKHGGTKYRLNAIDLQTDEIYEDCCGYNGIYLQFEPIIEICRYCDIGDKLFINKVDIDNKERIVEVISFPKSEDEIDIILHKIKTRVFLNDL